MNDIKPLLELQDVDGRIREMEKELADIPARRDQELARLNGSSMALVQAKAALVDAQLRIKNCDAEAADMEEKVHQHLIAQATAGGNKEYQQLDIAIATLRSEIDAAKERKAAVLDEIPSLEAAVARAQERLDEERGGIDEYVKELEERLAEVKEQRAAAEEERKELAKGVSDRTKLYYQRLGTKRWPVVVALNDDDACEGCHMVQPPSVAQMVAAQMAGKLGPDRPPVVCTMCGRILYRD